MLAVAQNASGTFRTWIAEPMMSVCRGNADHTEAGAEFPKMNHIGRG